VFDLDASVPAELVPFSWLFGVWEGTGVLSYRIGEEVREGEFGQRIVFTHDGGRELQYHSAAWLLGEDPAVPYYAELGYWRLARPLGDGDAGPGLLPATAERPYATAEAVETLRNDQGAFDIEASIIQQGGVSELYLGRIAGPRIDLATDAVVRGAGAKEYAAATRLYGLVDSHLLWAWDVAALGQELRTHASGRLARME